MKYLLCFLVGLLCSCDAEPTKNTTDSKKVHVISSEAYIPDGRIPRTKKIYQVMSNDSKFSLDQMITLYQEDMQETEKVYVENLQNMWFMLINPRLISEGTDADKIAFAEIQMTLSQNLANIESFYNLLLSIKSWEKTSDAQNMASAFIQKNKNFIESIKWSGEAQKTKKTEELTYQSALFFRMASGRK
uniref:hypothetical protein n=1 Tax=Flavobacterium sp. TaxID=239 RepID=UPI004049E2F5